MNLQWNLLIVLLLAAEVVSAQHKKLKPTTDKTELTFPLETIYAVRKPERLRKWLHRITVSPSFSLGMAGWSHRPEGYLFYRKGTDPAYLIPGSLAPLVRAHPAWITATDAVDLNVGALDPDEFLLNTDTAALKFAGAAPQYNPGLRVSVKVWKINLGVGYHWDRFAPAKLRADRFTDELGSTRSGRRSLVGTRWVFSADYEFLRRQRLGLAGQIRGGKYKLYEGFSADFLSTSLAFGGGLEIRWNLTESLQAFAQPSLDYRSFGISSAETTLSIKNRILTVGVQAGFNYNFPELRRCYHKLCRVQMNHPHGNREYRSRAHPIYKKQNPGYGENHPEPVKTNRLKGPKAINP